MGLIPQIVKLSDMPLECLGDLAHVLVQTASKCRDSTEDLRYTWSRAGHLVSEDGSMQAKALTSGAESDQLPFRREMTRNDSRPPAHR